MVSTINLDLDVYEELKNENARLNEQLEKKYETTYDEIISSFKFWQKVYFGIPGFFIGLSIGSIIIVGFFQAC